MTETIGNPLSWAARSLAGSADHVTRSVDRIGGEVDAEPRVQTLSVADLRAALRAGYADFQASRADVMFICLLYPAIGAILIAAGFNMAILPVVFPVAAGFALIGPLAAVGLYEISRQRESGAEISWLAAFAILRSPNFGAIAVLGLYIAALFLAWVVVAHLIWQVTLGPVPPVSTAAFLVAVLTTGAGWAMIVLGMGFGFCFALAVLATSVVSFPLLLDRNIGVARAVVTSLAVFRTNRRVILIWGAIVATLLVLGSIPAFIGLIVVLPVLGHATWHLYRRAVTF